MDIFAPYEQAHKQEGEARQRMEEAERQLLDAVSSLMSQRQGRLFLRWLIHHCQCFSAQNLAAGNCGPSATTDAVRLGFAEGRRYVGMTLLHLVQRSDPGNLPQLLQNREDEHDI
ncbi:hypothetical protein [Desulfovibrio intestinalis]|uniref:Bbp19-like phage domain-containing protein n=1 Tax=Desulfovibrio intestinalis TaxID=58621 RepID=A0A7W8C1R4_9BACT|nr:hypothetical protein [Desulfovibrio intestinalis]MBB5143248.1 hypothetical protein [Desulfovibrio intestinalis]